MINRLRRPLTAVTLATLFLAGHSAAAQTPAARFVDSARVTIDRAVSDMDPTGLDGAITLLDRALVVFPDDAYLLHYRGYARYWQVVGTFMAGKKETTPPTIQLALADLRKSAERLSWPETLQLEASLNGLLIAIDQPPHADTE